jgi:two-component system CheB/CheR fusion protein
MAKKSKAKKTASDRFAKAETKSKKPKKERPSPTTESKTATISPTVSAKEKSFPIVGIGASAGGLEAFKELLEHLPTDTGMAIVLVQHLAPKHQSMLTELLSRATVMPVEEVKDGMHAKPNHVYVIPPNTNMAVLHGILHLMERPESHGPHMPIDYFLRSLAEDQSSKAIGVILSGTASDGALGLKAIKAEGGITFAQDEKTAKYFGMPSSAIAAGYVDFVLPPEKIANELARIGRHPYIQHIREAKSDEILAADEDDFDKILILLRRHSGVDFTHYKQNTIKRRLLHRMVLHKIERIEDYIRYSQNNPKEIGVLYHDILINVTGFFRDAETFEILQTKILPKICANGARRDSIRVWVPGCSTGEEAYSLAISILEYLGQRNLSLPIQIFATDISDIALDKARAGAYLENITQDVSPERLRRFFVKVENGYQISKSIREMCVFAKQNVTKDPPFSKLDLISCRNVLIYLGPVLQKKVMPIFHYALKATGFLMLGHSETIGGSADLFSLVDKKYKIYTKKTTSTRPPLDFTTSVTLETEEFNKKKAKESSAAFDVKKEADKIILNEYAPAGFLIDDNMEILQFRGRTSAFLDPAPGEASLNLLKLARPSILFDLRTTIHKARKENIAVKKDGLRVQFNGQHFEANLEVIPISSPSSEIAYYLVLFDQVDQPPVERKRSQRGQTKSTSAKKDKEREADLVLLKKELAVNKDYLQSIIEEQEATNEELRSANEEIQSSNEELQSTNEELETAKEELQSTNEELTTVNEELENRNLELSQVNNDLTNLLNSIYIPIIMLGNDLRIRRYTAMTQKIMNVIPTDIGRKISDIKPNVNIPDLERMALGVIDSLRTEEKEIQDSHSHWYSMRIRPYKTSDNKIEGVVIAFVDIDGQKRSESALREETIRAQKYLDVCGGVLVAIDLDQRVRHINKKGGQILGYSDGEIIGKNWFEAFVPEAARHERRLLFQNLISGEIRQSRHDEYPVLTKTADLRVFGWDIYHQIDEAGNLIGLIYTGEDITHRKFGEQKFQSLLESAPDAMVIVDNQGNMVMLNAHLENLFGYRRDELLGQPIEMLIPERLRSAHVKHRADHVVNPHVRPMGTELELFAIRKDGSEFPAEISLSPLWTENGVLISSAIRMRNNKD